jgi:hypothetical protein
MLIENTELTVTGRIFRTARLRHEGCEFLQDPVDTVEKLRRQRARADVLTFVHEVYGEPAVYSFHQEPAPAAVLSFTSYEVWWNELHFKVRNKIRKAHKHGVELRVVELDGEFARGVEAIYNESPIRQGRKFYHYGKTAAAIEAELTSFMDRSILVGAYHQQELIGFMKLYRGSNVMRTVHILAKNSHRDKAVMDALIAKAVELCDLHKIGHLQYGSWTDGGVGTFRSKHGFVRVDYPRYFVPLTSRGALMLRLKLHRPIRELLPERLTRLLIDLRTRWYASLQKTVTSPAEG